MSRNYNNAEEITSRVIESGTHKLKTPFLKTVLAAIAAGVFIAIGAEASSAASYTIESAGVAKLVAGCIFPIGLVLIVLLGGQLFTSSCMNVMSCWEKAETWKSFSKNILTVYISNFIGAFLLACAIWACGQLYNSSGSLGGYAIFTAVKKAGLSFGPAFVSGILCNILVCLAVVMGAAAKDITGKILAISFPICAFIISGFEHCVANMYYIPAGVLASRNPVFVQKAIEKYGLSPESLEHLNLTDILCNNFIPVTLGNFVGGAILVSGYLYLSYRKKNS